MKTVTIGYTRDDGDFAVLATLNNNDDHLRGSMLGIIAENLRQIFAEETGEDIQVLERQDATDYIDLGE